jgi:hypothetical protein
VALIKIVKNTSGAEGTWRGFIMQNNDALTIDQHEWKFWKEDDEVRASITSGDLTMNDGTLDLSPADGLLWLDFLGDADETSYSGVCSGKNVKEAIDNLCNDQNQNSGRYLQFGRKSDTGSPLDNFSTEFLVGGPGGSELGHLMFEPGTYKAFSAIMNNPFEGQICVLKNGTSIYTKIFTGQSQSYEVLSTPVSYVAGDIFKIKFDSDYVNPSNPFECYSESLMILPVDGDTLDGDRVLTNLCNNATGMGGRIRGNPLMGQTGPFGTAGAIKFDEVDDYIEVCQHTAYKVQDCTLEFWYLPNALSGTGDNAIISKTSSAGKNGDLLIQHKDARLKLEFKGAFGATDLPDCFTDTTTWKHIAITMGTGGFKLYVNGTLHWSHATTQGLEANREVWTFGARNNGNETVWDPASVDREVGGTVAEIRFSDTVRYTSNFQVTTSKFTDDANTLGLWHLDEASGGVAYDSSSTPTFAQIQWTGSKPDIVTSPVRIGTHSISFTGSPNDWLRINHTDDFEQTAFTVGFWFNMKDLSPGGMLFHKGSSATEGGIEIRYDDISQCVEATYYGATTNVVLSSAANSVLKQEWHHVSFECDATEAKLCLDGVCIVTTPLGGDFSNVLLNNKEDIYMGKRDDGTYLGVDYIKVYYDHIALFKEKVNFGLSGVEDVSVLIKV